LQYKHVMTMLLPGGVACTVICWCCYGWPDVSLLDVGAFVLAVSFLIVPFLHTACVHWVHVIMCHFLSGLIVA